MPSDGLLAVTYIRKLIINQFKPRLHSSTDKVTRCYKYHLNLHIDGSTGYTVSIDQVTT